MFSIPYGLGTFSSTFMASLRSNPLSTHNTANLDFAAFACQFTECAQTLGWRTLLTTCLENVLGSGPDSIDSMPI